VRTLAIALATVGGVGYAPVGSGTVGSLVALPLLPPLAALRDATLAGYAAVLFALVSLAVWAAGRAEEILGGADHGNIVIDEVVGMVLAGALLPGTWSAAVVAFVLFRVFDIAKPFPAGRIDENVDGGLGVVGDDVVAGAYASVAGWLLLRLVG
jgi:phosphatidylglycerophosphatase A